MIATYVLKEREPTKFVLYYIFKKMNLNKNDELQLTLFFEWKRSVCPTLRNQPTTRLRFFNGSDILSQKAEFALRKKIMAHNDVELYELSFRIGLCGSSIV